MKGISIFKCRFQVLIYILVLTVLLGCSSRATEASLNQPSLRVLSARDHSEEAWRLARQWRDDAELVRIKADVIGPGQTSPPLITFKFESPSENQLVYGVTCFSVDCTGEEFGVSRTSGFGGVKFAEEMIDSIEAAAIGYQNGGDQFAYTGDAMMSVSLERDKPRDVGPTVWQAYYVGLSEGGPLYVVIDPYTGEVIRIEE